MSHNLRWWLCAVAFDVLFVLGFPNLTIWWYVLAGVGAAIVTEIVVGE